MTTTRIPATASAALLLCAAQTVALAGGTQPAAGRAGIEKPSADDAAPVGRHPAAVREIHVKGLQRDGLKQDLTQGGFDHPVAIDQGAGLEDVGNPDDTSVIELQGPAHRYAIRVVAGPQLVIEVDRVRLLFSIPLADDREALALETAATIARRLRASRHPRVFADESWVVQADAPDLSVLHRNGKDVAVLIGDRVFDGTAAEAPDFRALARASASRRSACSA